ncbi:hypothetical protein LSG31_12970 [Fodinisporobacter ferrooxydans]|uniref:Uncharacterized protein n=1 Tax=Fodinisporobacter ferrooxydans TaxID=2901836 RepID=A0ABY4CHD6_9BACL|nr:hypothetical protein LSG31_12970 [Alicyclobacillaceae bacterium MYW30-H2]
MSHDHILHNIEKAKEELREAEHFVKNNNLEHAEKELIDAIKYATKALEKVQHKETE